MADEKATLPRYAVGILTGEHAVTGVFHPCDKGALRHALSDSVSSGSARDQSGPALRECIEKGGNGATWTVTVQKTVGDNARDIRAAVKQWADNDRVDLIVTTGGTGFGIRDVTPEAVAPILDRQASGLVVAMLVASLTITPFAALARPVAGTIGRTLIITLPGSPKGSVENLMAVWKALPHALELNRGSSGKKLHDDMNRLQPSLAADAAILGFPNLNAAGNRSPHRCSHHANDDGAQTGSSTGLSNDLGVPVAKRRRTSPYPLVDVEDAMRIISRYSTRLDARELPVDDDLTGFVLAEDVVALESVPGYRASVVDGYAVIGSDGPGVYDVISATTAGEQANIHTDISPLWAKQVTCTAITAPIPPGANPVVMAKGIDIKSFGHMTEETPEVTIEALENAQSDRGKCAPGIGKQKEGDSPGIYCAASAKHVGVHPLRPGQIVRVTTGAPVPPGATAVVMVEDTKLVQASDDGSVEKRVEITVPVRDGENVREIGVDTAVGEVVMRKGELFTAVGGEHAALASVGATKVLVHRKPVVAILSSGSEIVDAGCPRELSYGQVRDCNRVALRAAVVGAGFEALDCGIVEDLADKVERAIVSALARADVLITTGGVSMGEKDLLKSIIERSLKGTVHFGRVNMKPGCVLSRLRP
ncbi:MAG: MoaB/Mog domain-containing protein [Olpidium bornovanus]|uniref:MoaB/Mog domain-containing protein n=1 Tax=Olpidium bornovanus TaxID=278681 RepID=A0A8H7ZTE8_9FUNG|nr:MAG: MoaB/Mog domain-containing protein [Olpidium bornovanus]